MGMPDPGTLFQNKYRLNSVLGRGGFATVYLAIDETAGRRSAIKIIDPGEYGYSSGMEERFLREVRVLSNLRDPHTVTMFDYGRADDGLLFMVFEYIEGEDLEQLLARSGAMSERSVVHILIQVLQSLREAHANGLLHRDIKPANIRVFEYMGDRLRAKLLDFGIAREAAPADKKITQDGAMVGTPQYMAPEQVFGDPLTPASDIYSLGLVAFEMLAGRPAVDGETMSDILRVQASLAPIAIPTDVPLSPQFREILEKMLIKHPRTRFQNAKDVLDALQAVEHVVATAPTNVPRMQVDPTPRMMSTPTLEDLPQDETTGPSLRPALGVRRPPPETERPLEEPKPIDNRVLLGSLMFLFAGIVLAGVIAVVKLSDDEPSAPPIAAETTSPAVAGNPAVGDAVELAADNIGLAVLMSSRETTPKDGAIWGCGGNVAGGDRVETMTFEGRDREVMIHAPISYDPNTRHPVVFLFHDNRETRNGQFLDASNFRSLAQRRPMIVISPLSASTKLQDNIPTQPWTDREHELNFATHLLRHAQSLYCIDPDRVYVVGHGGGGKMADAIRCELPVSAVATTSYRLFRNETLCETERAVPVLQFWGERDGYSTSSGKITNNCVSHAPRHSLKSQEDQWRKANGCSGGTATYEKTRDYQCREWKGCDAATVSCVHHAGHGWPGSTYSLQEQFVAHCFGPPPSFDMAGVIYDFFERRGIRATQGAAE